MKETRQLLKKTHWDGYKKLTRKVIYLEGYDEVQVDCSLLESMVCHEPKCSKNCVFLIGKKILKNINAPKIRRRIGRSSNFQSSYYYVDE